MRQRTRLIGLIVVTSLLCGSLSAQSLVATPRELATGVWVGQGLDFYGDSVRYRL